MGRIVKLGDRVEYKDAPDVVWVIQGEFREDGVYFNEGFPADISHEILNRPSGDHLAFRKERDLTETEIVYIVGRVTMRPYPGLYGPPTTVFDFNLATPNELTVAR